MKKVVLILVDALKYSYITKQNTPFLYQLSRNNISIVKPSGGFCERSEIFSGLTPNESDFFTALAYDERLNFFHSNHLYNYWRILEKYPKKLSLIYPNFFTKKFYALFRKIVLKLFKLYHPNSINPYKIPLYLIPYFKYTEDELDFTLYRNLKNKTIFNLLKSKKKTYSMDSFTSLNYKNLDNDDLRFESALKLIRSNKIDFIPIYLNEIDKVGHDFGPESIEIKNSLRNLDNILSTFSKEVLNSDPDTKLLFLGDHGMTKVNKSVNIEKILIKMSSIIKVSPGKHYFYFVDSTIFRLWAVNKEVLKKITDFLYTDKNLRENGKFIRKNQKVTNKIPNRDLKYGELLWWAKPGTIIFPDFFRNNIPPKGMHGYDPNDNCSKGVILNINCVSKMKKEIELKDVYKILIKELKL